MEVNERIVGKIKNRDVIAYELANSNGFKVTVLNYGGIIKEILVPSREGKLENVVLAYRDISSYEENPSYLGAIIGRTSGRICNGEVSLNGRKIKFNKNYGLHQGHGGNEGFNKSFWKPKVFKEEDKAILSLEYFSPNNEENYPGNLNVRVEYSVTCNNELIIRYYAKSDQKTMVNLTNHSYFNLSGNLKNDVLNQYLKIDSDYILELDSTMVPSGRCISVDNTPFDFRGDKEIGQDINKNHYQLNIASGYDHTWLLNKGRDRKVQLYDKNSGRVMDIYSNQISVVVYSMNFPDNNTLYTGRRARKREGICFEMQSPPIGRNEAFLDYSILNSGELYSKETIFKFYTK